MPRDSSEEMKPVALPVESELAKQLLASFVLYPGMTLLEAARGFMKDNEKRMNPIEIQYFAAGAIVAGYDRLAAALLGLDPSTGEKLPGI